MWYGGRAVRMYLEVYNFPLPLWQYFRMWQTSACRSLFLIDTQGKVNHTSITWEILLPSIISTKHTGFNWRFVSASMWRRLGSWTWPLLDHIHPSLCILMQEGLCCLDGWDKEGWCKQVGSKEEPTDSAILLWHEVTLGLQQHKPLLRVLHFKLSDSNQSIKHLRQKAQASWA